MPDALDGSEPRRRGRHRVLSRILRERGWNQADLARAARVNQNVVSRLMLLKFSLVWPGQVAAIAAVCGVHPLQLVPTKPNEVSHSGRAKHETNFSAIAADGGRVPTPVYSPEIEANTHILEEEIRTAMRRSGLTERELLVVTRLYGLGANSVPVSAQRLAAKLGISVARVNQNRQKALAKMRLVIANMRGQVLEEPRGP